MIVLPVTLYLILSGLYLLTQQREYAGHFLVKALPILLLAGWAFTQLAGPTRWWVVLALLFCASGDIALGLDNKRYFVGGLGLFLVGHLLYAGALLPTATLRPLALLGIFLLFRPSYRLVRLLYPKLGSLRTPVLIYAAVIFTMTNAAILQEPISLLLAVGAASFMVSDACIAIDKFLQPLPRRNFIVMSTYYVAQLLLVLGFLLR